MDKFTIVGGKRLSGKVRVDGSKNACLPIIFAAILPSKGVTTLHDVPNLRDIDISVKLLRELGATVSWDRAEGTIQINAENISSHIAPYDLVRQMRASFLVLGPLLARVGKAKVSLPGGCSLGQRPVNLHIKGFQHLGAEIVEESGYVIAECGRLSGGVFCFDRPSHTGTENLMTGAVTASGTTIIVNAAMDPEVVDLAEFLNEMGAAIDGAGSPTIVIKGVKELKATEYTVMPDRLVAGTFMCVCAATGGRVELDNCRPADLGMVIQKLQESGAEIRTHNHTLAMSCSGRPRAFDITTFPFPGFPTDLQPCFASVAAVAEGVSHIRETVFEDRFASTMELIRMGADIRVSSDEATITGVSRLQGATVMASDIRAGAGLVTAALAAENETTIRRIYHVDRGYAAIEQKLSSLGADIKRVPD
jgi:UDP-N-acetylglucosamine 1-carboxyvinyltransferase